MINAMADNPARLEFLPGRAWDHSIKRFGSTEKALRGMGFNARIPLQEGIRLTMDWTRQNMQTLEACILKHAPHMNVQEPATVVLKDI
jgi:nucleoside-diphosphate-sugar epimerase